MRRTSIILILSILTGIFSCFNAHAVTVNEKITEYYITKGVTRTHIKKLTSEGWYNINYITVDLNEPTLGLKVLSNDNSTLKSTVLELAKNDDENVVAAINSDFFTSYSSSAAAEGMTIKDGELITTPSNDVSYATFSLTDKGIAQIGKFTFDIMVTSKRTNDSSKILFYNKNADPMYLKVYDKNFGTKTPGSMNDGYEVVVEDNIVTEVLSNKPGVEIPENGYVLHNSLRHSLFLSQNFQVGDEVVLDMKISPDIENIKEAVGGGTVLLENGEISDFTLNDSVQPMTAIGIDKTGKILTLFTVDGRIKQSRGMSFSQIAKFLKNLGCYSAMSFDGGGSTTMVAAQNGNALNNVNIQSSYRPIINAVGITAQKKKGSFKGMEVSASASKVFTGQPVEIFIDNAYDEYGNSYDISNEKISYTADRKGKFNKNIFYPQEEGKTVITVTVNNEQRDLTIDVYGNPTMLTASVSEFDVSDKQQTVNFFLKNDEGYSAYIPSNDLSFSFYNAKGYVKDDKLTLTKVKDGYVTAIYNDITLSIPIGDYEIDKNEFIDKFQRTTDKEGYNFSVFGVNDYSDTLFSNYIINKRNKLANNCDLAAFRVIPDGITVPTVRVSNYGREDTEHSLFLKLDNSKGGLVATKGEQWEWLLNVFKKGVPQKNVFINMPLDIAKVRDTEELAVLKEILKENLPDKNIFIITYGEDNTYKVEDGIRFITVTNIPRFSQKNAYEVLEKLKYAKFNIVEGEVYFEFAFLI